MTSTNTGSRIERSGTVEEGGFSSLLLLLPKSVEEDEPPEEEEDSLPPSEMFSLAGARVRRWRRRDIVVTIGTYRCDGVVWRFVEYALAPETAFGRCKERTQMGDRQSMETTREGEDTYITHHPTYRV